MLGTSSKEGHLRSLSINFRLYSKTWSAKIYFKNGTRFLQNVPSQQSEHCDWLVLGHVAPDQIQMYPDRGTIPQLLPAGCFAAIVDGKV